MTITATCYHVYGQKTVFILSLRFVPSLQSAFCTNRKAMLRRVNFFCINNFISISEKDNKLRSRSSKNIRFPGVL